MAVEWIILLLAAMGLLSICWAAFGWLLPGGRGMALVCWGVPDPGMVARWRWLRGLGFTVCPMIAIVDGTEPVPLDIEICGPETLVSRLEWERIHTHGTGNGDSSGRGQRCDFSEL